MTTIEISDEAVALAADHGIDPEAVALSAVADAIEAAVLRAADEAANQARQEALATVAEVIDPLRPTPEPEPDPVE
jgi:hypothetical protein